MNISNAGKIGSAESNIKVEMLNKFFQQRKNPGRRSSDLNAEQLRTERDALLKEIPVAIFYLDTDLRYTSVSQAFADSVGLTISNVIGKTVFDLFPANLATELQEKFHYVLQVGESITNVNYSVADRNNQQVYYSAALAPVYGGNGLISGLVGVNNDISELTRASLEVAKTSRDNNKLLSENRLLTNRLYEIQENERRRIARELHDELGQWITALRARLQAITKHAGQDPVIYDLTRSTMEISDDMQTFVRGMLQKLWPVVLDNFGLADSLRELQKDWRKNHPYIDLELVIADGIGSPVKIEKMTGITVYRLVQESLNNVCKHARARKVVVRLRREKKPSLSVDNLLLTVVDDGIGFDVNRKSTGFGLLGMRERAIAAGGEFLLQSSPGRGVRITVRLPFKLQD